MARRPAHSSVIAPVFHQCVQALSTIAARHRQTLPLARLGTDLHRCPCRPDRLGATMNTPRIGQRNTRQRAAVVDTLEGMTTFASAQDIHATLTERGHKVGLTTVYRTLQQLNTQGMIDTLQDDSGETLYRNCSSVHHHHHLVCTACRRAVEIDGGPVERWASDVAEQHAFVMTGHTADVFGLCSDCAGKQCRARASGGSNVE